MADKIAKYRVLISCAGNGSRFGGPIPKQYATIGATTVLDYTLKAFLAVAQIEQIVIITSPDDSYIDKYASISPKIIIHKVGGHNRAQSVLNGLNSMQSGADDWVLVHDAVRCCITPELIQGLIRQLGDNPVGGILAIPATDTLKLGQNGIISKSLDRSIVYAAQTPQMFRYQVLQKALLSCSLEQITDDASAVEQQGLPVLLIKGAVSNIKLTCRVDLELAKIILGVSDVS